MAGGRCRYCGRRGEVFVPNLGDWVCEEHFMRYFRKRVRRVLNRLGRGRKVLVGVSGGKDSLSTLLALADEAGEYGLELGALMIDPGGREECADLFRRVTGELGIPGEIFSLKERLGVSLSDPRDACALCGTVTRYVLNRYAYEAGYDYVATGHNLDDNAYFALNNLITHNVSFLRYLDSVTPPMLDRGLVGRVRPLFWLGDADSASYVRLRGLEPCEAGCPPDAFDKQRLIKPLLDEIQSTWPDSKVNLVSSVRELARRAGVLGRPVEMGTCSRCGFPSRTEVCSFCRTVESMGGEVPEHLVDGPVRSISRPAWGRAGGG